jgi:phage-related protein
MRLQGKDGVARAVDGIVPQRRIIVVQVLIKTTRMTTRREIDITRLRSKEVV